MTQEVETCLFCSEPATIYCDALIALPIADYVKPRKGPAYPVTSMEQAMLATCDAPCCAKHSKAVGHVCGGESGCETIDRCMKHASDETEKPMIAPDKVPDLRRQLHRKWRLELVHLVQGGRKD